MLVRGRRAVVLVALAGLRRARRRRAHARGLRRRAARRAVREPRRSSRTSARTPARRRAACGCCGRRARSSSRSSCSGTARSSSTGSASPTSPRGGGVDGAALAARRGVRRRAHRGAARRAAADRRRPPPLRDDARLPRAGRHEEALADGRDRPDRPGRADDLPDAPHRAVGRTASAARRSTGRATTCPGLVLYRGRAGTSCSRATGLDPEVVDRLAPEGVTYTPHARRGGRRRRPRRGARRRSCCARRGSRTSGRSRARGDVMPQKSTFFYPKLTSGLLLLPAVSDRLARGLPRVRSRTCARVLDELPTRAEREPVVGAGARRRRDDGDRQGGRGRDPRALPRPRRDDRLRGGRAARRRRDGRRRRPDRRLAEREARHPVLLASRSPSPTARRWATSTSATSTTSARARSGSARRGEGATLNGEPLGAVRPKDDDRDPLLRGDAHLARSRATRRRSPGSRTGCGSWARSRSRSAISPRAASTRSAR